MTAKHLLVQIFLIFYFMDYYPLITPSKST
jgi:hypothetical protein